MDDPRDLKLELTLDAPTGQYLALLDRIRPSDTMVHAETSDPLTQWFTPKPWSTINANLDVRPGGRMSVTMRSPEGEEIPNTGVYLEIVPKERLVTTDAYSEGWLPSEKPFMTSIITLADVGQGKTAYRAVARHWRAQDREAHEKTGFHDGWNAAARQLEALAKTL